MCQFSKESESEFQINSDPILWHPGCFDPSFSADFILSIFIIVLFYLFFLHDLVGFIYLCLCRDFRENQRLFSG